MVDGQEGRGMRVRGVVSHLLSLARHDAAALGELAVARKANEITAAPPDPDATLCLELH